MDWVKYAKKRLNDGNNLDAILNDIKKKGASTKEIEHVLDQLLISNHQIDKFQRIMHPKLLTSVVFMILVFGAVWSMSFLSEKARQKVWEEFDDTLISDPVQVKYKNVSIWKGDYEIKPVAKYKASVMVAKKKAYSDPPSPFDFVFLWGELAKPDYKEYLSLSQAGRKYIFRYQDAPHSKSYIAQHSVNTHMIPANSEVLSGLKAVLENQVVYFEGYLVNIHGPNGVWKTSTTRSDTGMGSCEVFYVYKMRIGDKVYT